MSRGSSKYWSWSIAFVLAAGCGGRVELLVEPPGGANAGGSVSSGASAGSASAGSTIVGAGGVIEAAGSPTVAGFGPNVAGSAGRASAGSAGFGEAGVGGVTDEPGAAGAAGVGDDPLAADQISAGATSTCARLVDGSLRCWGANSSGQLGNGTFTDSATPVKVQGFPIGLVRVRSFSVGDDFVCAVLSDGNARCWGAGNRGQLGNGALMPSSTPVPVRHFDPQFNPAFVVRSGGAHSCALTSSGAVQCWGANDQGQLGNGTNVDSPEPSSAVLGPPTPLGTDVQLGLGTEHACLMFGNRFRCWGANHAGQLGDGTHTSSANPVDVMVNSAPTPGISFLGLGGDETCLLDVISGARCWGRDGASPILTGTQVPLPNGTQRVFDLEVGGQHACEIPDDRRVYCWGAGEPIGQAGPSPVPAPIAGLPTHDYVAAISAGGSHSCALMRSGSIYCWGDNRFGQLGVTGVQYSASAVRVPDWH